MRVVVRSEEVVPVVVVVVAMVRPEASVYGLEPLLAGSVGLTGLVGSTGSSGSVSTPVTTLMTTVLA